MVTQERLHTIDDLWAISHLPQNTGKHFELIEGVLYEMPPTGWLHGDTASELGSEIRQYVKTHQLGRVTAAETGFILFKNPQPGGKDTVLAPDVGFIAAQRVPQQLPDQYVPFAPDLAVEVISPGNSDEEINLKVELYLRYGTRLVWIVYPKKQKIHVFRASDTGNKGSFEFLGINDSLDGESVLPGFRLALREIFFAG
jgi:Uma2 family endonuclease